MNAETIRALTKWIKAIEDRAVHYRQGVVTDDSPLSVALGGSDVPYTGVATLDTSITVGDTVAVLTFKNDLLVLGKIGADLGGGGAGGSAHTIEDEGSPLTQRSALDFQGAGVAATDSGTKTVVTIPGAATPKYQTVQEEGSALTQRAALDFAGAGVTATDDAGGDRTVVTIPGMSAADVKAILASLDAGGDLIAWEKVGTSDDVATIYAVVTAGSTLYTTVGSDSFTTDTFASAYTYDRPGDNPLTIVSGTAEAWTNSATIVAHTTEAAIEDSRTTLQWVNHTSAFVGTSDPLILVKRLSNGDALMVGARLDGLGWDVQQRIHATDSYSSIVSAQSGGATLFVAGAGTPAAGDWFRHQIVGNVLTMERWTTNPALGGTPANTATFTLTGAYATKFGTGVTGKGGFALNANKGHYDNYLRQSITAVSEARELWVSVTDDLGVTTAKLLLDADGLTDFGHVIQDEGSALTQRSVLNFAGAGVTAADAGGKTVVTIPGATSGHTIKDEGTSLTARTNLDFVGAGVTATDDAANDKTIVTIGGGGSGGLFVPSIVKTFDDFTGWTFDSGVAGDWTLSGGKATNANAGTRELRIAGAAIIDGKAVLKWRYLANNPDISLPFKWIDANNWLMLHCFQGGGSTTLALYKKDAGVFSAVQSYALASNQFVAGNDYWMVARWFGNRVRLEMWNDNPRKAKQLGGFERAVSNNPQIWPNMSIDHLLAGANATKYGTGISGDVGVRSAPPAASTLALDDFAAGGYVPAVADDF